MILAAAFAPFGLNAEIESVLPTSDGSAWTISSDRIGRHTVGRLDGAGHLQPLLTLTYPEAAIGPDGQGWFVDGDGTLYRGATRLGPVPGQPQGEATPIATGPDGTLWAPAGNLRTLTRVATDGRMTTAPLTPPRCARTSYLTAMARAADNAMWFADAGCERVLRLAPDGSWRVAPGSYEQATYIVPDLVGGAWVTGDGGADYITAADKRLEYHFGGGAPSVAVAADGAAWIAHGRCELTRVAPGGTHTTGERAPVPARRLAFAPDGRLWLASRGRIANGLEGAEGCDETPPRVTLPRRVSRTRGVTLTVSEPARLTVLTRAGRREVTVQRRWRYRPPAAALRAAKLKLHVNAVDRDGNEASITRTLRVTR